MNSCEGIGKNIEQAIQNALLELKVPREDVDIKILSEGGFLKKARVLVSISEDCLAKYEQRDEKRLAEKEEEEKEAKKEDDNFAQDLMKKKIAATEEKHEEKQKIYADEEISLPEKKSKVEKNDDTVKRVDAKSFVEGLLSAMDIDQSKIEIERTEDERYVTYHVKGEGADELIGHHGECMLALSQIMSIACENEDHKKVLLDVEDYRAKRKESLVELAKRVANKVAKSGRYFKLEPMDASERKIIHTALQDDDRVTTLSKGEEPKRYLIVFPKEYKD